MRCVPTAHPEETRWHWPSYIPDSILWNPPFPLQIFLTGCALDLIHVSCILIHQLAPPTCHSLIIAFTGLLTLAPEAKFKFQTGCYGNTWAGLCLDVFSLGSRPLPPCKLCSALKLSYRQASVLCRLWVWSPAPHSIKLSWTVLQFLPCRVASQKCSAKNTLLDGSSFLG